MSADEESSEVAHVQARERSATARAGIGAVYLGNVAAHEDGWRGMVAISDGGDDIIDVLVAVRAEVPLGPGSLRPDVVAALVEEMAADYPEDGRLHAMQAGTSGGPGLRLDERFPDLWRTAFG